MTLVEGKMNNKISISVQTSLKIQALREEPENYEYKKIFDDFLDECEVSQSSLNSGFVVVENERIYHELR